MSTTNVAETTGSVDLHAHIFPAGLEAVDSDHPFPTLRVTTGSTDGELLLDGAVYRKVRPSLWSLPARLEHLDQQGVSVQLVSPVPVTLAYAAPAGAAASFMRGMNEGIADQVRGSGGRLVGLGSVPLQDCDLAVRELEYLVQDLGLAGAEIGSMAGSKELDAPELDGFFAAAADLGARIMIHPKDGGTGVVRRAGQPYDFGLGMLTDTALAAGALVFGGVLDKYPDLKVLLSHGGGSFAWTYPRMRMWAALADDRDFDAIVRRLYVDCLVFDSAHIGLLMHRFGSDRVTAGTDFPFFPDQEGANRSMLAEATNEHHVAESAVRTLFRENGLRFLGLDS